ncbi:MAG: hypothetical protein LH606_01450 [Cytophagaceae bacterium]|nr:hypothetical protein [Cytophagaceae bacterium]
MKSLLVICLSLVLIGSSSRINANFGLAPKEQKYHYYFYARTLHSSPNKLYYSIVRGPVSFDIMNRDFERWVKNLPSREIDAYKQYEDSIQRDSEQTIRRSLQELIRNDRVNGYTPVQY